MINKLLQTELFMGVDRAILEKHLPAVTDLRHLKGSVIFRAGSRGSALYLILSGKISLVKRGPAGEEVMLGTLTRGEVFGELDIIDGGRRSSDAVALTDCRLLRIPRRTFAVMLKKSPTLGYNLLKALAGRLRGSDRVCMRLEEEHASTMRAWTRRFESLMDAAYLVHSSLNLRTLLTIILDTAVKLVDAERGTLYLIDEEKGELCSRVVTGSTSIDIRLALGEGIAGHVACTGEVVNLADAYSDPRFNPKVDRVSGFVSRAMLCMPMRNRKGRTIGVIQLLNTAAGRFTTDDEIFVGALGVHAAHAIENARLADRMIAEERLSAVGRMAAAIVHDIKNPLHVLRLSAELLGGKGTDPEVRQVTDIMIDQIDRFDSMAQEIIEFSRGTTSLKIRPVGVEEIVRTVIDIYSAEVRRRGITLRKKVGFRGRVGVDFDKIVRCLQNIIGNALDVLPRGGTLGISTARQGPFFKIAVTDDGPGIPEEIRDRIFEPFVSSGKAHGTGLGLPIVKKIVKEHRGTVEVASQRGRGTRISISLPVRGGE
jgi:signal transduction histidine kinase